MRRRLLAALDAVTLAANVVGSVLIAALVGLITVDVAGRNAFGAPLSGVPEMVSLSIVAIVFLQARFPSLARGLETVFDLVGIAVLAAILYAHWPRMVRSWVRSDFVGAVGDFTAPTWPIKAMLALGCILLALQFGARILRRFAR